jgi:hypothetical protein
MHGHRTHPKQEEDHKTNNIRGHRTQLTKAEFDPTAPVCLDSMSMQNNAPESKVKMSSQDLQQELKESLLNISKISRYQVISFVPLGIRNQLARTTLVAKGLSTYGSPLDPANIQKSLDTLL